MQGTRLSVAIDRREHRRSNSATLVQIEHLPYAYFLPSGKFQRRILDVAQIPVEDQNLWGGIVPFLVDVIPIVWACTLKRA